MDLDAVRGDVAGSRVSVLFNGALTVEGATQIKAANRSNTPSNAHIDAILELKGALNKFAQDITLDDNDTSPDRGRAYLTLSGSVDQTIEATGTNNKIKAASDGEGTIRVLNGREGQSPSKATFDIQLGHDDATTDANDRRLKQLTVGDADKGGHAIFNRGVHVDAIDVISGNHTNEVSTVEFRSDVSGDRIRLTDGGNTDGTAIPKATAIFNARDTDIRVETKIVSEESDDGVLRVVGGVENGQVRKVTFNDEIGVGDQNRLLSIVVGRNGSSVADAEKSGGVAVFKEDVVSFALFVSGGNAAAEDSHAVIEKDLTAEVTLTDNDVAGNDAATAKLTIGGAGRVATVTDTGQTMTGDIEAGGDGQGELVVDNRGDAGTGRTDNNTVTFTGSVGADGTALRQITLKDGKTTFNGDVYARIIDVDTGDATTFKGDVTAVTRFHLGANSGSVTFASRTAQEVTGRLTTQTAGRGEIIVTNKAGVTFKNDVGTSVAKLNNLTLTGDATAANASRATFAGHVYLAGGLTLGQNTRITLNGTSAQTVTGDLTSASGGNYGDLTITNSAGVSFTGSLGASGAHNGLNQLSLNANAKATFGGNVYLAGGLSLGDGSRITLGGSGNQTFKGSIANGTNVRGSLVVNNTGTTNKTVIFEDAVGVSGNGGDLARVAVRDGVAQFKGNVFAQGIALHSTDGAEFKGDVTTGTGGILFTGDNAAKMTLNGDDDQEVTGDITADFDGRGLLVVHNTGTNKTVTFGGSVGADGTALQQITLSGGKATFNRSVYADTIAINTSDATTFKGDVKAQTKFQLGNGSSVTFNGRNAGGTAAAAQTITGDLTSASGGNYGDLTITNSAGVSFTGSLGTNANKLNSLTLTGDATAANASRATFGGNVYLAGGLTLGENTRMTVNGSGDQEIAATLTNGGNDGHGDLVVNNTGGTVTFANAVGATGGRLNEIELNSGTTVFGGAVYADTIDVNAGSTTFEGAVHAHTALTLAGAATFKGAVTATNSLRFDGAGGVCDLWQHSGAAFGDCDHDDAE